MSEKTPVAASTLDQRRQQHIIERRSCSAGRSGKPVMFISSIWGAHDHVVAL
jgi:hypothetical protein